MLIYSQSFGTLWNETGQIIGTGYSGRDEGKNNPAFEAVRNIGPIPCGMWTIGQPYDSGRVGPLTLPLSPIGHDAHKRTDFRIHGDRSPPNSGTASHGCMVFSRAVRERIHADNDRLLKVIA